MGPALNKNGRLHSERGDLVKIRLFSLASSKHSALFITRRNNGATTLSIMAHSLMTLSITKNKTRHSA